MNDREIFPVEVPLLTEDEKKRAVAMILDTAMPAILPKSAIWRELCRTAGMVGLRTLFFGVGDCFFLAALVMCVCLFPAAAVMAGMARAASCLFLISPAFYALSHLLTMWKEYQTRTLEWKWTWRISFRTILALRMLVLGAVSVVESGKAGGILCLDVVGSIFGAFPVRQFISAGAAAVGNARGSAGAACVGYGQSGSCILGAGSGLADADTGICLSDGCGCGSRIVSDTDVLFCRGWYIGI